MSEPLLLLPGMMCDARLWLPQVAALSAARTVQVGRITEGESVGEIAAAVLAEAPARFALAGLSMGGIVAMEVIAQAPDRVTRIALFDTNPKSEHPKVAEARAPLIAAAEQGRLEDVMAETMRPEFLADGPGRDAILALSFEMARGLGTGVFVRQSRALATRPDMQEALRRVAVPALILCGAQDRLCPPHRHELMAGLIPGAVLEIIEAAGHLPTLETPEAVNAAMARDRKSVV